MLVGALKPLAALAGQAAKILERIDQIIDFVKGLDPDTLSVKASFEWRPKLQNFPKDKDKNSALFYVDPDGLLLSIEARASGADGVGVDVLAELRNFGLNLFMDATLIRIAFDRLSFRASNGRKPEVDVVMNQMQWQGVLSFIATLEELIPSDGFADPPYVDVSPSGVKAGFDLALPNVAVGVFSLENISLGADVAVPFLGDAVTVGFHFCTREKPFRLTVLCVGGGGFVGLRISPKGIVLLEMSLEACAQLAIDLGVASGSVSISVGVYLRLEGDDGSLTGYFRIRGEVDVLGLISASITLELSLKYEFSSGKLVGRASIEVEVEVLFFSFSVTVSCERRLAGSNNDPTFAELLGIARRRHGAEPGRAGRRRARLDRLLRRVRGGVSDADRGLPRHCAAAQRGAGAGETPVAVRHPPAHAGRRARARSATSRTSSTGRRSWPRADHHRHRPGRRGAAVDPGHAVARRARTRRCGRGCSRPASPCCRGRRPIPASQPWRTFPAHRMQAHALTVHALSLLSSPVDPPTVAGNVLAQAMLRQFVLGDGLTVEHAARRVRAKAWTHRSPDASTPPPASARPALTSALLDAQGSVPAALLLAADAHLARRYYQRPEEDTPVPRRARPDVHTATGHPGRSRLPPPRIAARRPVPAAAPARPGHRPAGRRSRHPGRRHRDLRRHRRFPVSTTRWSRSRGSRAPSTALSFTADSATGDYDRGHAAPRRRRVVHHPRPRPGRVGAQARAVRPHPAAPAGDRDERRRHELRPVHAARHRFRDGPQRPRRPTAQPAHRRARHATPT